MACRLISIVSHGGIHMRLGLGAAALLSLLFIIEAAVVAGIMLGAAGFVRIPAIDPRIAAILVLGTGLMAGCGVLYRSYS